MRQWILTGCLIVTGTLLLAGCASTPKTFDTENLCDLENMTLQNVSPSGPSMSEIRRQALRETAMSIGAQGALALRSQEINAMLKPQEKQLDQIYNFTGLMLSDNVLPPVLEKSDQALNLNSPNVLSLADRTYKIIQQAHFVTTAPTWRTYLEMNYKKPDVPDSTLLPKSDEERKVWIKYLHIGWQQGIDQANNMYARNMERLQRDYKGMMLYRDLLAKHMVTPPYVVGADLGVTSNRERTVMQVNNRVLQIAATPEFNTNSESWKPIMVQKQ